MEGGRGRRGGNRKAIKFVINNSWYPIPFHEGRGEGGGREW